MTHAVTNIACFYKTRNLSILFTAVCFRTYPQPYASNIRHSSQFCQVQLSTAILFRRCLSTMLFSSRFPNFHSPVYVCFMYFEG